VPKFKTLLAPHEGPLSLAKLIYPVLCSPKLDGIRCIIKGGVAYSRKFIPLPSYQVQVALEKEEHLDGELIVGNPTESGCYNKTQSHVMARDKPGPLTFYVFDYTSPEVLNKPFTERHALLPDLTAHWMLANDLDVAVEVLTHTRINCLTQLLEYETTQLEAGHEGIMIRDPDGIYKQGRATINEGIIFKLKRFTDDEGTIVGFEEGMTNTNVAMEDALGNTKRSYAKAGMIPAGTLGKFIVSYKEDIIDVAPGAFTHDERQDIWDNQSKYMGKLLKFRYFNYGVKDKPRFPRAIGFRDPRDL